MSSNGYTTPTRLESARVIDVQTSKAGGSWAPGAVIGGGLGVLSGGGHSTESKVIRAAGGALIGAAVNKAITSGQTVTQVMVQTSRGQTMQVAHNYSDLIPGDCVMLETRRDGDVQLQRTSATQCNF